MRGFWPIFKRELFAFFVTPLAWVLVLVFLLVQGLHFFLLVDHFNAQEGLAGDQSPMQAFFGNTVLLYIILFVLIPPMTMRLFAEERRVGTIEPLMTAPVGSAAIVMAKYLSALTTYVFMWAPTLLYLVILRRTGEIDWGVAASSYLGVFLIGAGYLAVGLLASALTRSQFLALVISALAILVLFIVGVAEFVTREGTFLHALSSHVSVWSHMNDFASGIIDSRRIVFYVTMIALPLYATTRTVDALAVGLMLRLFRRIQIAQIIGLAAAVFIAIVVNVLAERHYKRWDATSGHRYTLSPATLSTLAALPDKIEIWVILGAGDPLEQSVKQLLVAYQAETRQLDVHYIDPDRDAVALVDVQQRFKIEAGRSTEGRVVTDAVVVVARGERHWFLTAGDMFEAAGGDETKAKPREEHAITGAIRSVLGGEKSELCFTVGHGELSLEPSREGSIGDLRSILEKDNYAVRAIDLAAGDKPFAGCAVVVVAGAVAPFAQREDELLRDWLASGGSALVSVGPVPGRSETGLVPAGLERSLGAFGMATEEVLVVDPDPAVALPGGRGTEFFATPKPHTVTDALVPGGNTRNPPKIAIAASRAFRRATVDGAPIADDILTTSPQAYGVRSVLGAAKWSDAPAKKDGDPAGPFALGMAAERAKTTGTRGARMVALGSRFFLADEAYRQPRPLRGAAFLVESALSWLASRPVVLDVPDRPAVAAGIRITEESRSEVRNYVLIYMPLAAALLGLAIALRRYSTEGAKHDKEPKKKKRRKRGEEAA